MRKTIEESGRTVAPETLDQAVRAGGGYAFMIQLVGFTIWDRHPEQREISAANATAGMEIARAELRERIAGVTYTGLSKGDRAFL